MTARNRRATASLVGAAEAIVGALEAHPHDDEVQRWGCFALGKLAEGNRRKVARTAGVMPALVSAVHRHVSEGVVTWGVFALSTLVRGCESWRACVLVGTAGVYPSHA